MRVSRHRCCVTLLWLLSGTLVPATLVPAPQTGASLLHKNIEHIHCATDGVEARHALRDLQQRRLISPGLPNEAGQGQSPQLRATTLDKILLVLATNANKFPENKPLVEETVVQWNFCSVIDNGTLYDHQVLNGKTSKYPSALANSHSWNGFRKFGLLGNSADNDTFNFSSAYTSSAIRALADNKHQQRYIDHCLPHPDDKHLYRDFGKNIISRIIPFWNNPSPLKELEWTLECPIEHLILTDNLKPVEQSLASQTTDNQFEKEAAPIISPPLAAAVATVATVEEHPVTASESVSSDETPLAKPKMQSSTSTSTTLSIPRADTDLFTKPVPRVTTSPWSGDAVVSSDGKLLKGLSGSISVNNRAFLSRNTSLDFSLTYRPIRDSYWFIRSGLNISQESKPLTYSWGIGYDDWHPGTWGIQLNHWGPLEPGDGLDINNAIAEVSYKFKSPWLDKFNLSSSVSLTTPFFSGRRLTDAALNMGWSWNPRAHWFIRSTLSQPIGGDDLRWSYGFGYTRYSNKSLSLEYNNWGVNEFPEFNFKENASISLIYRWAI